jgi:cholesterol oxidase
MNKMHFDSVIVGSGFGGSIMAYRLAQAGLHVCLLERGKAYPPGSFPRSPYRMKNNFWDPSDGKYGLFNIWSFGDLNALVSSGLGGGSLIYSNVMLRKDEKWFVKEDLSNGGYEYWPVSRADLDPHYDSVEKMLNVQQYPFGHSPYLQTPRTNALKTAAAQLNLNWYLPNLAVTFGNQDEVPVPGVPIREDQLNFHGSNNARSTCRLCSECNIGCNYGSKNTLDYNYLSEAKRLGAEIKTCCEVRSFEPFNAGYSISYVEHNPQKEGQPTETQNPIVLPLRTITADRLILSAGTFGTTYLLLKNRAVFPHISQQLGKRISGNGDFLAFARNCTDNTSGNRKPRVIDPSYGPAITSTIRIPDGLDGGEGRGFYIQDAGYPEFVNWILQMLDIPSELGPGFHFAKKLFVDWVTGKKEGDISGDISALFGTSELSACLLPLDGMGRDIPNGSMQLNNNLLDLDWYPQKSSMYYDKVRKTMIAISSALGAEFVDEPLWYFNRVITAHPLGGCPMGENETMGVVNSYGEVFNYPNLYIADGSVMPGPVGANPSLTIAALADRFAECIIQNIGKNV